MTTTNEGLVSVSRRINAPVGVVFAQLTDPTKHPSFDGSGMVRDGSGNTPVSGVGDSFTMQMHNDSNGDYVMRNLVVEFIADQRLVWEPERIDLEVSDGPAGYLWGYELSPDGPDATNVTEFFDCSRAPEWLRTATDNGNRWVGAMSLSLERLDEQCGGAQS